MKDRIELIPLIELPTFKDEGSKKTPNGSSLRNTAEWDKYQMNEIKKNYNVEIEPVSPGIYQYEILKLSKSILRKAIELHISDVEIKRSCSFFGGYGLKINSELKLYPQCCGLFEEIRDWKKILNSNFKSFYFKECHPSPKFDLVEEDLIISCKSEDELFIPKTDIEIKVNHKSIKSAINSLIKQLTSLSTIINEIGLDFNEKDASKYLIWGED